MTYEREEKGETKLCEGQIAGAEGPRGGAVRAERAVRDLWSLRKC